MGCSFEKHSNKVADLPLSESDGDDEEEALESADSCSDSDYDGMFSNVTHLEISLADLQRLAEENHETSDTTAPSILSTGLKHKTNHASGPTERPTLSKGTLPEDILAAILEDDSSGDEQERKKRKRKGVISASLPAFQGTRGLNQGLDEEAGRSAVKKQKLDSEAQLNATATTSRTTKQPEPTETNTTPESCDDDEEEEEEQKRKPDVGKSVESEEEEDEEKSQTASSSGSSSEEDEGKPAEDSVETSPTAALDSEEEEKEEQSLPRRSLKAEDEEEQQRKANLRRLAAVQQRQKEAEEHKKLIQGALANPVGADLGSGLKLRTRHFVVILFDMVWFVVHVC